MKIRQETRKFPLAFFINLWYNFCIGARSAENVWITAVRPKIKRVFAGAFQGDRL